ncbi:host specificity factor TipJ family phage tail protein [Rahnella variigena]|uniref:host specificity factor TipJ family phage tail protein n=1 Tax=Rahnella variigena TaxID=574964 RepID=UPI0013303C7F|nr:host specificity factor TipJ family phage tail protein [Rahnella variigena]
MPLIEIQRVPGMPKERHELSAGKMFYPWLKGAGLHAELEIFRNGVKVQDDDDINFPLNDGDVIRIFDQPKSGGLAGTLLNPLEHFNPIKFTQKIISSLMPQPNAGAASGNSKTSPNNSLKGQTNIARNGEARPDTYGTVRSFPDLIQESLFEYTNNLKYVTEMMNFGLGKYDYSSIRYSESNLGSMAGASYTIYQPGEVIPTVNEGYEFDDVDGQEVPGANESSDFPSETANATTVVSGTYSGGQIAMKIVKQSDFDYFMDLTLPHAVTFTINITYPTASGNKTEDITLSANLIAVSETNNGATVSPIYYYNFIFNNLKGSNAAVITTATINTTKFILNDNEALVVGPFFSPVDSSQLWVHTQSALGGNSETNWKMTLWKVDDNNVQIPGTTQVFTYRQTTPHDSSSETFYRTDKITPTGGYGRYAISFQRTDNSSDASTLKVEEIHAVNVRNNVVHPTDSIVRITVRATENATGSRERKYNALITRHTITYNMTTQSVDYTLRPSRSFADAVIHTWLVMGKQKESSIDIYELYSIAASLPDVRLGYFDYTFDDEDISLGSRVQTICDAATVTAFWDDGVLSFSRDEKKSNPVTVFNRANMTTEGYSLSYDMTLPGGFDGVEVEYRNPTTNKQDYIRYKISGSAISEGEPAKPKKFEMLYVRDAYQARDRAVKEVRRLLYSRITAAVTAIADGEWINVGQMIQIADIYDENQQDGYITGRVGNTFDTSERINFSGDMYVVVTDSQGSVTSRVIASARPDTNFGFIAAVPNIPLNIWDGINVQSPSRYIIATQVEQDSTKWTVTEKKPNSSGTTSITAVEYSDEMFNYVIV